MQERALGVERCWQTTACRDGSQVRLCTTPHHTRPHTYSGGVATPPATVTIRAHVTLDLTDDWNSQTQTATRGRSPPPGGRPPSSRVSRWAARTGPRSERPASSTPSRSPSASWAFRTTTFSASWVCLQFQRGSPFDLTPLLLLAMCSAVSQASDGRVPRPERISRRFVLPLSPRPPLVRMDYLGGALALSSSSRIPSAACQPTRQVRVPPSPTCSVPRPSPSLPIHTSEHRTS